MKRIIKILILCFLMLLCFLTVSSYAENSDNCDILKELGIAIETNPDHTLSRAEAAEILFKASGCQELISDVIYNDVDTSHLYYKEISSLTAQNVLNGDENLNFHPDSNISCLDFTVALIRLAGFKDYAEARGGYPAGYLKIANEYDLISGNNNLYREITYKDAWRIIIDYLDMPYCSVSGFAGRDDSNNTIYNISESYTVLEYYFSVEKRTGTVVAANNISLFGHRAYGNGCIAIVDSGQTYVYKIKGIGFEDFLGCEVYYWLSKDDEFVISIKNKQTCEIIELDYNNIKSISADRTKLSYYHEETGKTKNIIISHDATFILNGSNNYEITPDEMHQQNVKLRLINTAGDKKFDIVYVDIYENIVVGSFDAKEKVVTDRLTGKAYKLDDDSFKDGIRFILGGTDTSFSDVRKGDVLSILTNMKETKRSVYISRDYVEGYVTTISPSENSIDIDDISFNVFFDIEDGKLSLGEMIRLYIDYTGVGFCYEKVQDLQGQYAYLLDVEERRGLPSVLSAKFLLENGDIKIYDFHKAFKVNGKRSDYDKLITELSRAETIHQLVYLFISDDKVKSLYTAPVVGNFPEYGGYDEFSMNYSASNGECLIYSDNIGTKFVAASVTKAFYIAVDDYGDVDEDELRAGLYGQLGFKSTSPKIKVYDSSVYRVPKAVVVYGEAGKQTNYFSTGELSATCPFVIDDIFYKLNEEDEYIQCVTGMVNGVTRTFYATDGVDFNDICSGDVILLSYYRGNELFSYEKLFTIERTNDDPASVLSCDGVYTEDAPAFGNPSATSKISKKSVFGIVEEVGIPAKNATANNQNASDTYASIVVRPEGGNDDSCITLPCRFMYNSDSKGTYFYLYDTNSKQTKFVNFMDIDLVGKKVYSYFYDNRAKIIVLYE